MKILVHITSFVPPSKNKIKATLPLLNHTGLVQSVHMSFLVTILLFLLSPSSQKTKLCYAPLRVYVH